MPGYKDRVISTYWHTTHNNRYLQKKKNPYFPSVVVYINLSGAQGSIFKLWSDPLYGNEMRLMGCLLPAILNNETKEKVQVGKEKVFFSFQFYIKKLSVHEQWVIQ